jgi:hypothetical protein
MVKGKVFDIQEQNEGNRYIGAISYNFFSAIYSISYFNNRLHEWLLLLLKLHFDLKKA